MTERELRNNNKRCNRYKSLRRKRKREKQQNKGSRQAWEEESVIASEKLCNNVHKGDR